MKYLLLGRSGLRVSELCLGTMTFGTEWGWGSDKQESKRVFDTFVEKGGNFLDTANRYTEGTSEKYVGEFVKSERDSFVLATKYTLSMRKGDLSYSGNSRKNMMQSLEASLKRLGTDYIDLYWLHAWDFTTPVDEVMRSLDDMVKQGKVLYIGISDTPAWIVARANTMADLMGWTAFTALQIEYSLLQRTPERDLLPMAKALDIAVTPWAVLGGGALSGKFSRQENKEDIEARTKPDSKRRSEWAMNIAHEVDAVADEIGCSSAHVAINWVRQQSQVIVPIVGARSAKQLQDNLGSVDHELTQKQVQRLDDASVIEMGFPHDFLKSDIVQNLVYSEMGHHLRNHKI